MKYEVWIKGVWHKYIGTVEADNEDAALELADNHPELITPYLCHQCSGEIELSDIDDVSVEEQK